MQEILYPPTRQCWCTSSRSLLVNNSATSGALGRAIKVTSSQTDGSAAEIIGSSYATTGSALVVSQNSNDTSARNVMSITQSNANAESALGLLIDMNTTAGTNSRAFKIDSEQTTGKVVEIDATEITTGEGLLLTQPTNIWKLLNINGGSAATTGFGLVVSQDLTKQMQERRPFTRQCYC